MSKKRNLKKATALLLAFIMVFGAAPAAGFAGLSDFFDGFGISAQAASESDLTFKLIFGKNEYEVTDCNDAATGALTIPTTYNGKPVTSIGKIAFLSCIGLTSITIPDSVTNIGDSAFCYCTGLSSIIIPDSVTSIERGAFSSCTSLRSITIPDSVTSIGADAFYGTAWFNNQPQGLIYIGKIAYKYKGGMPFGTSIDIRNGTESISNSAFYECSGLIQITIPDSVTSIGDYAFYNCTWLSTVTIPDSVTSIGGAAFYECTNLSSITIPDSVTNIQNETFRYCSMLSSITIPDSVTSIEGWAFAYCTRLSTITIPDSVTSIGNSAFCDTAWYNNQPDGLVYIGKVAYEYKGTMPANTSIVIRNGTTSITGHVFEKQTGLTSIYIPNSVTSIGSGAFYDCTNLSSITVPDSVTSIGGGTFVNTVWYNNQPDGLLYIGKVAYKYIGSMPAGTSIIIRDGTKSISDGAFSECTGLSSITIPVSVTSIGDNAFYACTELSDVYYGGSESDLSKIEIDYGYDDIINATWHYNNNDPEVIAVTGVTVSPTNKTLEISTKQQLTVTVAPANATNKNVTWTSSNAAVATVSSTGLVSAKAAGKATITATTADGGKTASCAITVTQPKSYIVSYNANGGSGTPAEQTKTAGEAIYISSVVPTKAYKITYNANGGTVSEADKTIACTFDRWNTAQNGSGTAYTPGASYSADADITLYAQWSNPKAGTLPTPTRRNYVFEGWFTLAVGGTKITAASVISASQTIFAHWTAEPKYTLTVNSGVGKFSDGSTEKEYSFQAGEAIIGIETPTRIGYTFIGWNSSVPSTMPAANITFTAQFSANSCTVEFYDDSVLLGSKQLKYDESGTLSYGSIPSKTGFIFAGWSSVNGGPALFADGQSIKNLTTVNGGVIKYYAVWSIDETETVLTDDETGVELIFEDGTYNGDVSLSVEKVLSGSAFDLVENKDGVANPNVFSIQTFVNGSAEQPSGNVKLKIPVPTGCDISKCKLYYINLNTNQLEEIAFTVESSFIVFTTNHFSFWAIVEDNSIVPVTGVTVSPTSKTLEVGATQQLTATVAPANATNKNVTWVSSNTSIATVSANGLVTAIAAGTATITVTTEDGNKTATCAITVDSAEKKVAKIEILSQPNTVEYTYKNGTFDKTGLSIKVTYSNVTSETITDTSKIDVRGFNANQKGKQNLTVKYGGCETNITVTVKYSFVQWLIVIFLFGWLWY